jgi:hypothetical protein
LSASKNKHASKQKNSGIQLRIQNTKHLKNRFLNFNFTLIYTTQKRVLVAILCLLLILSFDSCTQSNQNPSVQFEAGILNASEVSQTGIRLKGPIDFYWKQFPLTPQNTFDSDALETATTVLIENSSWKDYGFQARGYGTYHFTLTNVNKALVLNLAQVYGACEVWANGLKLGEHGKIATNNEEEQIGFRTMKVDLPEEDRIEVYLLVSNHKKSIGGSLAINTQLELQKAVQSKIPIKIILEVVLVSIMILFGLYYLFSFFFVDKNKSLLFIALFSLIGFRQLFDGEYLIYYINENIDSDIIQKSQYIGYYLALAFLMLYHRHILPKQAFIIPFRIVTSLCFLGVLYVLFAPAYWASFSTHLFQVVGLFVIFLGIFHLVRAIKEKDPYAVEILIADVAASIFLINDILNFMLVIQTTKLMNFGILAYILSQTIITKKRYLHLAKNYESMKSTSETLKEDLKQKDKEISKLLSVSELNLKSKETILNNLKKIKNDQNYAAIQSVISDLSTEILADTEAIVTDEGVQRMNHELITQLKTEFPSLTKTELEICMYISMKIDRRAIAKLRNTSFYAVKTTVYRIRKKMDLPSQITLDEFIEKYTEKNTAQ